MYSVQPIVEIFPEYKNHQEVVFQKTLYLWSMILIMTEIIKLQRFSMTQNNSFDELTPVAHILHLTISPIL